MTGYRRENVRTIKAALLALLTMTLLAGHAHAQSFDCAKAKQPDEKAICADRALADQDVRMATLWWVMEKAPMMMGARGAARDAQRAFLKERTACAADKACIAKAYGARIDALEQAVEGQMQDYCKAIQLC